MTLPNEDVAAAFRWILGREVESDATVQGHKSLGSPERLRAALLRSMEFADSFERGRFDQPTANPVVIHLHIPKAAGTSLNSALGAAFKDRKRFAYTDANAAQLAVWKPEDRHALDLVFGHLDYGIHRLLRENYLYVFILRRPIERLMSLYAYIERREDHPLNRLVAGKSFGDFLRLAETNRDLRSDIDNNQVRMIAGTPRGTRMDASTFAAACRHAVHPRTLFGLTERMADTMSLLRSRGVVTETALNRENAAVDPRDEPPTLSDDERGLLARFTEWDERLYAFCAAYFEAQHAL